MKPTDETPRTAAPSDVLPGGALQMQSSEWDRKFRDDLAVDTAFEAGLLIKEAWIIVAMGVLVLLREAFL